MKVLLGFTIACDITWLYLALFRGSFWSTAIRLPAVMPPTPAEPVIEPSFEDQSPRRWPSVAIVVPARDEARVLGRTFGHLLAQRYPGSAKVVLVDDRSSDGTGDLARAASLRPGVNLPVTVVEGSEPLLG